MKAGWSSSAASSTHERLRTQLRSLPGGLTLRMPTVAPLDLDGHCVAAVFLDDVPHFALADGPIHRLDHGHKTGEGP